MIHDPSKTKLLGINFFLKDGSQVFIKNNMNMEKTMEEVLDQVIMKDNINELVQICYGDASLAGWHKEVPKDVEKYLQATQLMLIVSEISEAMEGVRKDLKDEKLTHRSAVEVELADAIIRIADFCGRWNLDLGGAVMEKLKYNKSRQDHKPENRQKDGGKKF